MLIQIIFYDYERKSVLHISDLSDYENSNVKEIISIDEVLGFRAVEGPRSFVNAQRDPKSAILSAIEKTTVTEGPKVQISKEIMEEAIANGANLLNVFPVYEEKVKDGRVVYKVRLVIDGRAHENHGPTFAETPTR